MQKDRNQGISNVVSNGHEKEAQNSAVIDEPLLTVIHFNDVYDLQPKGGSMGVCHFKAKVEELRKENPKAITLFSGDCFSPSTLTNIKGGEQMVFALNKMGIDCACYGNHQFDFQTEHTLKLARDCNWPWLLGNIRMSATGELLGDGRPFIVKEHDGLRIGILGVAGEDWLGILSDEYEGMLEYQDCYDFSNRIAKHLREHEKCDVVIALTHMRNNADKEFPHRVKGVDLVLGGHDHVVMQELIQGVPVIKSGSNFNHVGLIKLYRKSHKTAKEGNNFNYEWKISKVTVSEHIDSQLKKYVDDLMQEYSQYDDVIGYTDMPLQTRFTHIRTEESNLGNFFADLARLYYDTDICTINAGMIRNDALMPPGKLTYSKLSNIIDSPMVAKKYLGQVVFDFLEYGVSQYPGFAGQFPFISGLRFQFDHLLKPRVRKVWVGGEELDLKREYSVTTTFYQSRGGDGYDMLKGGETIVDQVKGTTMLNLLLKFFKAPDTHQQYQSIKVASKSLSNSSDELGDLPCFPTEMLSLVRKFSVRLGRIKDLRSRYVMDSNGQPLTSIAPIVDGRINCLSKVALQNEE